MLCVKDVFNIMTSEEKECMYSMLWKWKGDKAMEIARLITLEENEISYVKMGKPIEAIKALRERTGQDLLVCKRAIDHYRWGEETPQEE